jgi:hypothetical protein
MARQTPGGPSRSVELAERPGLAAWPAADAPCGAGEGRV